jgi:hypothetical protein
VVDGFDGGWIINRTESFAVPWADLLSPDTPSEVGPSWRRWTDTFEVYEQQCSYDFESWGCGAWGPSAPVASGESWRIRPEVIDGDQMRIDLYDAATGDLITSVVPSAELDAFGMEDILENLGRRKEVEGRAESFIVNDDGAVVESFLGPDDSSGRTPWVDADFAELDGRLYALSGGNGIEHRLWVTSDLDSWVTSDLDSWEALPLPIAPVADPGGWLNLTSDGSTMFLNAGRTIFMTSDGRAWAAVTNPLDDWEKIDSPPALTDFGWMETGDAGDFEFDPEDIEVALGVELGADPEDLDGNMIDAYLHNQHESPAIAVSSDLATWQLIPVPLPAAVAELGLTWSDISDPADDDGPVDVWDWGASAHGNTIFVTLHFGDQARELWVGRVDTS